jgi:hypothetical protein
MIAFTTVIGQVYTITVNAYVPSATTTPVQVVKFDNTGSNFVRGSSTSAFDVWQPLEVTFTATSTSTYVGVGTYNSSTFGQKFYVDAMLIQSGSWATTTYFDGSTANTATYSYTWDGTVGNSASTATALTVVAQTPGVVGWQKARLVAALGRSLYELDPQSPVHSDLPAARYVNPSPGWEWSCVSESPTAILVAGSAGNQSSILAFTLDSSGGTPFLSGGSSIATLPIGETILAMEQVIGSWLSLGTSRGIRVGTFDTYTGNLKVGPLSVESSSPGERRRQPGQVRLRVVHEPAARREDGPRPDRPVDDRRLAGRNAWAPDLRPPTSAPTGLGNVIGVSVLPMSGSGAVHHAGGLPRRRQRSGADGRRGSGPAGFVTTPPR